jgi:hypothetical protein
MFGDTSRTLGDLGSLAAALSRRFARLSKQAGAVRLKGESKIRVAGRAADAGKD